MTITRNYSDKTGNKGQPVESLITRFFGDINRWHPTDEYSLGCRNWTQAQIRAICQEMSDTGTCLWHAQSVVMGWNTCHCAKCQGVNLG